MHPVLPDIAAIPHSYWLIAAVLACVLIALRLPIVGALLRLAMLGALLIALAAALVERERFDPYLARIAAYLKLDDQQVIGSEVRIRMAPDGHFWARARIDGVDRRMLVDSGATVTALSASTAAAAGLVPREGLFPMLVRTANGTIGARSATVRELRLGDIAARDLAVVVSPAFGDTDVLGMNFLSRLKGWRVEDGTLVLTAHHPLRDAARVR